ncbi:hypothetical protein B7494_g3949 [Chlorociboria aeruginascens]|nr:hypothetical protein B7494_g3949 [Chlorociboria aeruginascens]
MSSKSCASCLRILQRQSRSIVQSQSRFTARRAFTTSSINYAGAPEPDMKQSMPIPPGKASAISSITTPTPTSTKLTEQIRSVNPETYSAFGFTEELYKECAHQADYTIPQASSKDEEIPATEEGEDLGVGEGWWFTKLGLKPTFSTWSQVTMLHMYLFTVRFRCFPAASMEVWQQHLIDHFFHDAEDRMVVNHKMTARGTRNRYLKDLFVQWRGLIAAYDEGIIKGDTVLAAAVWRNMFKADENVDVRHLAQITEPRGTFFYQYINTMKHRLEGDFDERNPKRPARSNTPPEEANAEQTDVEMEDRPSLNEQTAILRGPAGLKEFMQGISNSVGPSEMTVVNGSITGLGQRNLRHAPYPPHHSSDQSMIDLARREARRSGEYRPPPGFITWEQAEELCTKADVLYSVDAIADLSSDEIGDEIGDEISEEISLKIVQEYIAEVRIERRAAYKKKVALTPEQAAELRASGNPSAIIEAHTQLALHRVWNKRPQDEGGDGVETLFDEP